MSASMEVLGIGGHEKLAEDIFTKIKNRELTIVEVTKAQYDELTPEQKADPTKLYLVPGSGTYPKFREISMADYEALTTEEKNDPSTIYLTPGDGTYFRVIDLTQSEYDELTEDEKTNPNNLYLISDDTEYITTAGGEINGNLDVSGTLSTRTLDLTDARGSATMELNGSEADIILGTGEKWDGITPRLKVAMKAQHYNVLKTGVDLMSYIGGTTYTFPADGYLYMKAKYGEEYVQARLYGANENYIMVGACSNTNANGYFSMFVRKGMRLNSVTYSSSASDHECYFVEFIETEE